MLTPPSRGMGILLKTRGEGTVNYRISQEACHVGHAGRQSTRQGATLGRGDHTPTHRWGRRRTAGPRWPDPQRQLRAYLTAEGWESGVM
jgi:hypothetical protein